MQLLPLGLGFAALAAVVGMQFWLTATQREENQAIRETFAGFLAQWPDLEFTEQDSNVGEWGWVVRWTMSGTLAESGEVTEGESAEDAGPWRAGRGRRRLLGALLLPLRGLLLCRRLRGRPEAARRSPGWRGRAGTGRRHARRVPA